MMDLDTARSRYTALTPTLAGLLIVPLGRGRFALEGATHTGMAVWIERAAEARRWTVC